MTRTVTLPALVLTLLAASLAAGAAEIEWPSLDEVAHIRGRAATETDVVKGNAAFALRSDGKAGKPIGIEIPQYAFHVDPKTGKKMPVIVIQAEEGQGMQIVGYVAVGTGERVVDLLSSLQLLGSEPPR